MITCPRKYAVNLGKTEEKEDWRISRRTILKLLGELDCKKWIIGEERGKNGYEHWQIRVESSSNEFFERFTRNIPCAHIEKSTSEWADTYERKEGRFTTHADTVEILKVRFGKPNEFQKGIIKTVRSQSDRQVDVWYDPKGNHGKTWLTMHLWERGEALVVPRSSTTAEKLSAFVCSAYDGEPYIIIDIPRSRKITDELYEAIEELKDGLVFDHRYSGKTRNVRGAKIIIFTNTKLDQTKLSKDRWRLHGTKNVKGAEPPSSLGAPPRKEESEGVGEPLS